MPDDTNKQTGFVTRSPESRISDMWVTTDSDNFEQDQNHADDGVTDALDMSIKLEQSRQTNVEMGGEIWMSSGASRVPFTKREKEFLCALIQKHVYTKVGEQCDMSNLGSFNQKNMSTFCRVPNAAWKAIETEFNAKENVRPRSVKQLRKCWENLKHRGNIDPAALYSGKKLFARTSMSGAFTLTAAGEEGNNEPAPSSSTAEPPSDQGSFVETSFNEEASSNQDHSIVQAIESFSPDVSPNSYNTDTNVPTNLNGVEENLFRLGGDHTTSVAAITSSSLAASQLIASFSRSLNTPSQFGSPAVRPASNRLQRITNVRTVRSLKPMHTQPPRRRLTPEHNREHLTGPRANSNFSMLNKTNSQRIHGMKMKLMSARIKEHEANIEKVNMQMQQAQARHDVTMRLLRTKAAWYDAHLRKLEKQLQDGDVSLVGEDDEEYLGDSFNELEMQYEED
uniref:myb/SANT-like DNA-binding domain-containing protein 3 n=1 Tax=Styela clava TaxID=7725 RepID=UPI00193AA2E2|nr:myb/SANT-like DNA-binding domain-containing protein 3 [Styela clava]